MANLQEIIAYKKLIVRVFERDKVIAEALMNRTYDKFPQDLLSNIIPQLYLPKIPEDAQNFIFYDVAVPRVIDKSYKQLELIIVVAVHTSMLKMTLNRNRIDEISSGVDRVLNQRDDFGIGKVQLKSVTEAKLFETRWVARTLRFTVTDFNVKSCE